MRANIEAIIFDVGGTLKVNQATGGRDMGSIQKLQDLIGDRSDPVEFSTIIRNREVEYRKWAQKTLIEVSEADLWSTYLLPNYPTDLIRSNALLLNQYWRESNLNQILPDAVATIKELYHRGYKLAIVSNTTSSREGPDLLLENGLTQYFSALVLSTVHGRRKPHPSIFLDATRQIQTAPKACAYIGDQLSRDLIGPIQAGYGEVVIIDISGYHFEINLPEDDISPNNAITGPQPNYKIKTLAQLLDLYPGVDHHQSAGVEEVQFYDIALSTMWSVDQPVPFNQTFQEGRKAGFPKFEMNHAVNPRIFERWDKNHFYIQTVHDPCPAIYLNKEIKDRDLMISSLDERRRNEAVNLVKMTVDTAIALGSRSVVLHPGMITGDLSREASLREMYKKGLKDTVEYQNLLRDIILHRTNMIKPFLDQVIKSLQDIIDYVRPSGIELGLENRYHFYDIPTLDEMQILLDLCHEDWYGFQYDSGHAQALDALGFYKHEEWLKRYSNRMIGAHLHDVIGIMDHKQPGVGEVDFSMIASYLPLTAYRTLEVSPDLTLDELQKALVVLEKHGCVQKT